MPIYEYICRQCGAHTEAIQKVSDTPFTTCEACGGEVYRPISRTSFQLKGGGWYKDGYASSGSASSQSSGDAPKNKGADAQGSSASGTSASPAPTTSATKDKS